MFFKTDFMYSLYWVLVPFLIVIIVVFIREVDKGFIDTNIDNLKLIKRSYNDTSVLATVFYAMIYLIILFIEEITGKAYHNIYVVIGFLIITFIYWLFLYLSIYNAKKDIAKLLKNNK